MNRKYETEVAQNEHEIAWFVNLLREQRVRSYLEIGCRYGGSVWRVAQAIGHGARIVTVDLPEGFGGRPDGKVNLEACLAQLTATGYDCRAVWGDSTDPKVVASVAKSAPFDAIFIDADHRLDGILNDWTNYGPMGRLIAFHDIAWQRGPEWKGKQFAVPEFWNTTKSSYRHKEIKLDPKDNGIGVLWRE